MGVFVSQPAFLGINFATFSLLGNSLFSISANIIILAFFVYLLARTIVYLSFASFRSRQLVAMELHGPGYTDLILQNYEELFGKLWTQHNQTGLLQNRFALRPTYSLEITASENGGLKFLAIMSSSASQTFINEVKVAMPGVMVKRLKYPPKSVNLKHSSRLVEFRLKRHWTNQLKIKADGPLAFQASLMNLNDIDRMVFQICFSPLKPAYNVYWLKKLNGRQKSANLKFFTRLQPNTELSNFKLGQPLFKTDLRLLVEGQDAQLVNARVRAFQSSLIGGLAYPGRQMLVQKSISFKPLLNWFFINRLNSLFLSRPAILSASELASLYHFPTASSAGSELVSKNLSRNLPLSQQLAIKEDEVLIGKGSYQGKNRLFGLTHEERSRHMYIVGGTGNGKTTMLEYMLSQDIAGKNSVIVIDPHGDLAEDSIRLVPGNRIKDVIYFDPLDIDYPLSINLLELPAGLKRQELSLAKESLTESVISIFRKSFGDNEQSSAFRIERLLRNAVQTALSLENPTLFTVSRLLSDKFYRWQIVDGIKDQSLKRFWTEEFNKAGDYQRVKLLQGPLARLERYERNFMVKQIVGQPHSSLDIDSVFNDHKILICKFSRGQLGEDTSELLGSLILAKIQLASLHRQSVERQQRSPVYLYIDEFQHFANTGFTAMFSEARKYGLNLVIAQQSTAQIKDPQLLDVILDNVGSIVAFRSVSPGFQKYLSRLFMPQLGQQDIAGLAKYNFYAKLAADQSYPPVSGQTVPVRLKAQMSADKVVVSSRNRYSYRSDKLVLSKTAVG